jgi:hypothetical protein
MSDEEMIYTYIRLNKLKFKEVMDALKKLVAEKKAEERRSKYSNASNSNEPDEESWDEPHLG